MTDNRGGVASTGSAVVARTRLKFTVLRMPADSAGAERVRVKMYAHSEGQSPSAKWVYRGGVCMARAEWAVMEAGMREAIRDGRVECEQEIQQAYVPRRER